MPFDQAYYQRFYFNRRTAVTSRAEMRARARLITSCVGYIGMPVAKILDAGCGVGLLRTPLLQGLKRASYTGLEFSDYLCQRYGWLQGSIETYRTRERFDLVVCYDVLQYLSAAQARRAIANLTRLCRGALYFGALTREDWRDNCDQARTHRIPGLRPGSWYRRELSPAFRPLGCGMWVKRDLPLTLWNLDAAA
jgi:2-polyprenyl-3-methyl-5-hydroxy-6-metoxy-1,4-benzoquinol methylase